MKKHKIDSASKAVIASDKRLCDSFPPRGLRPLPKRRLDAGTLLAPVPAVLVSTARGASRSPDGKKRLWEQADAATFAWSGIANSDPPMLSLAVRPKRFTYGSIEQTGEFVVNLVSEAMNAVCDYCGVISARDTDKFAICGLTAVPAAALDIAPALAESPLCLSCRVQERLPLGSHVLYLARILAVEAADTLFDEQGAMHLNRARLVSYLHGEYYKLGPLLGFFGYSLARSDIRERRMKNNQA